MSITTPETTPTPATTTPAPNLGDEVRVETLPGRGVINGIWLGLTDPAAKFAGASVEAIVLTHQGDIWTGWTPPSGVTVTATAPTAPPPVQPPTALGALISEIRSHRATQQEFSRRLDTLVSDAHEWADTHDLCEVFDDFCENHDLPRRSRDYRFRVTFTGSVYITTTAHNEDAAREDICTQDVLERMDAADLTLDEFDLD